MKNPKPGQVYSFKEIAEELILKDSPFLFLEIPGSAIGSLQVIQTSHVSDEEMLKIPRMAKSLWVYVRTTPESIPLFWAVDNIKALELVNYQQDLSPYSKPGSMWVTPKGYFLEQSV
jgi:hypothetical protein